MKRRWIVSVIVVSGLGLGALGWAATFPPADSVNPTDPAPTAPSLRHGGGWGEARMRGMGRREEILRELDLSTEQRAKIFEIRDTQQRKAIQKRADIRIAELDLRKLMRAESPNREAVFKQIDAVARLRTDLRKSQVDALLQVRQVLTPDQRRKAQEYRMGFGGEGPGEGEGTDVEPPAGNRGMN